MDYPGRACGPRLDREPEHGAGRQQEAVPDERGDRAPLLLDADAVRSLGPQLCLPSHRVQVSSEN